MYSAFLLSTPPTFAMTTFAFLVCFVETLCFQSLPLFTDVGMMMMQSGMVKTDHYHLEGNEDVVCAEPVPCLALSFPLFLSIFPILHLAIICLF